MSHASSSVQPISNIPYCATSKYTLSCMSQIFVKSCPNRHLYFVHPTQSFCCLSNAHATTGTKFL